MENPYCSTPLWRTPTAALPYGEPLLQLQADTCSAAPQDSSPLTPGSKGLFRAGNGANLLAPSFGGWREPPCSSELKR